MEKYCLFLLLLVYLWLCVYVYVCPSTLDRVLEFDVCVCGGERD